MASSASAPASKGPRYAPPDPTLPKPWRGLIDGNTGYLYFWNPDTKVTQYERPVAAVPASPAQQPGYSRPDERPRSSAPSEVTTPIPKMWLCARLRSARWAFFFF
jgi:ATP-dependent RNA helicase DDX5/DBP2